jgi:hypothetical protein
MWKARASHLPERFMKERSSLLDGAPLLIPGARVEVASFGSGCSNLQVLRLPKGPILLSEMAAAILRLCDGRHSRAQIQLHLQSLGHRQVSTFLDPFLDAARDRQWVVEIRLPAIRAPRVSVCVEY